MLKKTVCALIGCALGTLPQIALPASAESSYQQSSWFYLGANYGYYKARGGSFDEDNDMLEGMAGFHFTPYLGIEASVLDFGDFGDRLTDAEADGWTAAAILRFPLTGTTGVYAKGGMLFWDASIRRAGDVEEAIDDSDLFYGIGLDFHISRMIGLNAEYVRYELDFGDGGAAALVRGSTDIDAFKLGVRLNF
jgi:hypothetical protein